jgi:hypothetical protein
MIGNGPIVKEAVKFIEMYRKDSIDEIRRKRGNQDAYTYEELE